MKLNVNVQHVQLSNDFNDFNDFNDIPSGELT